ncbi:cell adhesion molecule-related/down-regulated by oncogenes [Nerophis lumbriciformis]|uniref:cell adhesion molecule-related/down-regulated by oncogenes n=1 Tax=Nerophis lumbriciformis TaxID=546530 RepID=UPI002AE0966E|nr:cell adhesion molecule-related/down-regulated by oncogenes [Nerophis lumbriciformis]XP_061828398.1 cell adhesion molecule-related/down-regulated by oncogenes [Nerophis lumbriciformis]XP_061828399.1 cell adhesion molecule-related/down-regulated by oncogenes [Nerophis lumbriciformis]XP_061828400.1 cell adhesion molecule-related/down-regulated by oncogenes [Nerophis lumbriciformis]XP_061828401.1 cell adhesion molecule-related/down-regulated by oncogenes [Nerophis lumbriciformis]XP_061828402.1 
MDSGLRVLLSTVLCLSQSLLVGCTLQFPSFRSEPASLLQSPGSVARLRCSVRPPSAAVSWRFRGAPLPADTLPGVELSDGSLTISSLGAAHVGVYQCVARLRGGPAVASRHARVTLADISQYQDSRRRSLSVQEGSSALIECPLPHSVPPALPRLRVRGEIVDASSDDYLVLPSGNLQIVSASARHQGVYKCGSYNPVTGESVTQTHGTKFTVRHSASTPVRIVYPASPVMVVLQQSQPYTLECVVSGSPAPPSTWLKDGKEVPPGPSLRRRHSNLDFVAVTRDDEGVYACTAESERGVAVSANYTVKVLEPASITAGLTDQRASPGSSARFTCTAAGNPAPNVTWLFNAEPVATSSHVRISGDSLVITAVAPQDEGVYQCVVDNGVGSAQSSGLLTVQSELRSGVAAPDVPSSLPTMQSDEGRERLLAEDEDEADGGGGGDRLTPDAPIIISPPQTHKPDVYDLEWRAGPDGGSPINAYFVKYRKVDETAAAMEKWYTVRVPGSERSLRLSELEASSLYEVLMVARSSAGEGQPAMLTFRTGKEKSVSSSKKPSKPPVVLMPPKAPEDKTVNTHFGVVIHDRVPEAPDRPTISMATESSVYVTWIPRANGGSPVTAFRVECKRGRGPEWGVAADKISPLKLSVEVRNLEPGSTYRFRVAAINLYGESPHSVPSRPYQVPQASPRTADRPVVGPHITGTDAISDTQILLRWTYSPSSNNNTPIQGFYIYYRPTDSDNDSDYKRDLVEGVKDRHMIGHLQAETSYDIKMQCFNAGGESEYSNVMICETRARQSPGAPSQRPFTPPWPQPQEPPTTPGGLLYLIVGCVLGVMVIILLAFIAMCLWRNRQHNNMHKYDPPGYLYQPTDVNGHILEYTTLSGSGGVHGGYGHGGYGQGGAMLPAGCHHLHHKHPNGLALLNGNGGLFQHGRDGTLPHSGGDCEHPHAHHHHRNGGVYTALPQSESSDCMSCQNLCNNNRCYNTTNGTLCGGALTHRAAPCPQQDGLEMVPLGRTPSSPCPRRRADEREGDATQPPPDEHKESSPPPHSCCLVGDDRQCHDTGDHVDLTHQEDSVLVWDTLALPDLDCDEKPGWISAGLTGELIQEV